MICPGSSEHVEMYRRQCCRVPLPELKQALRARERTDAADAFCKELDTELTEAKRLESPAAAIKRCEQSAACAQKTAARAAATASKTALDAGGYTAEDVRQLAYCNMCGWDKRMPTCPIEWADDKPATWKVWRPKMADDGKSYRKELTVVHGTRRGLMMRLREIFEEADPHCWIERWLTHQRHLVYATFPSSELCISTDFSAQYSHKAAWTLTCEQPPRSSQGVYVVTHSPRLEDGERAVTTDIWRIFSEVKGDSLFHNTALSHIVDFYEERLAGLRRAHVFTDGCRGQYKGKRNFLCIAGFPSQCKGVHLLHRFACSHHFKGPHDAYGKDPKFLARQAERHGRARLNSTRDLYDFCAEQMKVPKKLTARSFLSHLLVKYAVKKKPVADLEPLPLEQLPEDRQMQALRQAQADVDVTPPAHVASESNGALQQLAEEVGEGDDGEEAAESLQHEDDVINEDASDSEAEEGGAGDLEFDADDDAEA